MDPWPRVTLFDIFLKLTNSDNRFNDLSPTSKLGIRFTQNERILWELQCDTRESTDGWMVNEAFTFLAADVLVVDIVKADVSTKLGSLCLDLPAVLPDVRTRNFTDLSYNVNMDADNLPTLSFSAVAASAPLPHSVVGYPYRRIQHLVFFDAVACHSSVSHADLVRYATGLDALLRNSRIVLLETPLNGFKYLVLDPRQFKTIRDRCLSSTNIHGRIFLLLLFARIFDHQFRQGSLDWMYMFSRFLYYDVAAALGTLSRRTHISLALSLTSLPDNDTTKTIRMQSFGRYLVTRHRTDEAHAQDDLHLGIFLLEKVEQLRIGGYSDCELDKFSLYVSLFEGYHARYRATWNISFLDLALAGMSKAMGLQLPSGSEWWASPDQRPNASNIFAVGFMERMVRVGDHLDLDGAMGRVGEALALVPRDSASRLNYLHCRGLVLSLRYTFQHNVSDWEESVKTYEELVVSLPSTDPMLPDMKRSLASELVSRFQREILQAVQEDEYAGSELKDVAKWLFDRLGGDVNRAIEISRELVHDHPDNPSYLRILGTALRLRFLCLEDKKDLDEAIAGLRLVWPSSAQDPETALVMGEVLKTRYDFCNADTADLHTAISALSSAATCTASFPAERLFAANLWADCGAMLDGEAQVSTCMDAFKTAMSIIPGMVWIGMSVQVRHQVLLGARLSSVPWASKTKSRSALSGIRGTPAKAAAFAIRHGQLRQAIEWLEQGQSIIWYQLLQFRLPLEDLTRVDKDLAERLDGIAKELVVSSTRPHFWTTRVDEEGKARKVTLEAEGQKHRKLASDWDAGLARARSSLPQIDNFLLPKNFDYLSRAAEDCITVLISVNVNGGGSDALVMFPTTSESRVAHIPLPKLSHVNATRMQRSLRALTREDFRYRSASGQSETSHSPSIVFEEDPLEHSQKRHRLNQIVASTKLGDVPSSATRKPVRLPPEGRSFVVNVTFKDLLSDIWYKIVQPIVHVIRTSQSDTSKQTRVRWCPTGPLASLPLHAAGDYTQSGKGHRVFDHIISSYIPTLNSVIRPSPHAAKIKILAISCASANGQPTIPFTNIEVAHIKKHTSISSCNFTSLQGPLATSHNVLTALKDTSWVHLACHGIQNTESPTESALLLAHDTLVTLSDIAALNLPHAELAFLSACQTATGYDKLPSESVHLAAGMLLAGYRSVVATMWSIKDRYAPQVADDFYGWLLRTHHEGGGRPDYKESAMALHLAVERLSEQVGETSFLSWVPFIHLGA